LGEQVSILFAVSNGYLDDVPVDTVITWEDSFHRFMKNNHPDLAQRINEANEITPGVKEALEQAIAEFKQGFTYRG